MHVFCFQFFKRYAGYLINMPSDKIDLIKPSDEISYYKCLIIRAEAASLKKPFVSSSNSLMWLNQSIADSFDTEEPNFEENVYVINEMKKKNEVKDLISLDIFFTEFINVRRYSSKRLLMY